MVKTIRQQDIKTFPNLFLSKNEAIAFKDILDITDKDIKKANKSKDGLLKIISGVGYYLSKRLKYIIN